MATHSISESSKPAARSPELDAVFNHVRRALQGLQFGTVTIVVQNGRVVQIERHEKTRLTQPE
jgi:hypothetical protein